MLKRLLQPHSTAVLAPTHRKREPAHPERAAACSLRHLPLPQAGGAGHGKARVGGTAVGVTKAYLEG